MRIVTPSKEVVEFIFTDWPGRTTWTRPEIEFDEEPELYGKIDSLEIDNTRYIGVTPMIHIGGNIYQCVIDYCEVIN